MHQFIAYSNPGSKPNNKDYFYPNNGDNQSCIYIISDGVNSTSYAEVASKITCETLGSYFNKLQKMIIEENDIDIALKLVQDNLLETETKYPETKGMACTIVFILFDEFGAIIGWLGDSRLYHIRNDKILYKTKDHSIHQEMLDQGATDINNVRNYITKCISSTNKHNITQHRIYKENIEINDLFFLCTDGVLENMNDEKIISLNNISDITLQKKHEFVFDECMNKTKDNYTYIILNINNK
jgi:protein phosphatase